MKARRILGGFLVCTFLAVPASWANPNLGRLECLRIGVPVLDAEAEAEGVTSRGLEDALLVGLKAKLPNLRGGPLCSNALYVGVVFILGKVDGRVVGYSAFVELVVLRRVTIVDVPNVTSLIVWKKGKLLTGLQSAAKSDVFRVLDEFLTAFAADYYRAGN